MKPDAQSQHQPQMREQHNPHTERQGGGEGIAGKFLLNFKYNLSVQPERFSDLYVYRQTF